MPDPIQAEVRTFEIPCGSSDTVSEDSKDAIPEEAVTAGIPAAAIDALARTLHDYEDTDDDEITWEGYRPDAKDMLDILAPILAAQARADERRKVAAERRAEGEKERVRLVGEDGNTMSRGTAIHNAITGWEFAAHFVEGEPRRGHLIIHNEPARQIGEDRDNA